MMFELDTCVLSSEIAFFPPQGEPLHLKRVHAQWQGQGQTISQFSIRFQVDAETYAKIDQMALFHLDPELRSMQFGGQFKEDHPIEIEAILAAPLLSLLNTPKITDIFDACAEIVCGDQENPLRKTESWWGTLAVQEVIPGLKGGYQMNRNS